MYAMERAIAAAGGITRLATRLNVSPQVVVHWRNRGVAASSVLKVEKAVDGAVTRHDLRPDLYPREAAA